MNSDSTSIAQSEDDCFEKNNATASGKTIVLGVTGSIAAYKAADLASLLVKAGHRVHALLTHGAAAFVTPLTLQTMTRQPVICSWEDESRGWQPGHIALAQAADLLLIAPATAHALAQLAHGLAPDPLMATYLALPRGTPVLLAPAMNSKMWSHPATQRNLAQLRADGCTVIEPSSGLLACGDEGIGRLAAVEDIAAAAAALLGAAMD